jgi:cephalosporin hydroxylase
MNPELNFENISEQLAKLLNTTCYGGPGTGFTKDGDSDWHLMTLFSLVLQNKSRKILELGVRHGDTSLPLTLGAYMTGGKVDAIDIVPTEFNCPDFLKPYYNFIQSDAIKFLESIPQGTKYDLIYIDDWHSFEHVFKELQLINAFIDKSTIILLHDLMGNFKAPDYYWPTGTKESDPEWADGGPYRAVKEFTEIDPNIWEWMTIPVNNGLTLLRRKV